MSKSRVIVDTNLWVSFLITKSHQVFERRISENRIALIFSEELILELVEVLNRPKFSRYFSKEDIENLLLIIENISELIICTSRTRVCRDEKDNFLLDLAKDGQADYLITGDNDLLVLKNFDGTQIIRFSEFEQLFS
ncbi:putative toxin-antitoxin system toxin component, PIN family [Halocola ammonii]